MTRAQALLDESAHYAERAALLMERAIKEIEDSGADNDDRWKYGVKTRPGLKWDQYINLTGLRSARTRLRRISQEAARYAKAEFPA